MNETDVRIAAAVTPLEPLRVGRPIGAMGIGFRALVAWLKLVDITKLDDAARAVAELFAMPRPSLDDAESWRAWVLQALDVAATVATVTRDGWDDQAVATLRRWLADASVLEAIVDLVGRFLSRTPFSIEPAAERLTAQGLPPGLVMWLLEFLLDLLAAHVGRREQP